MRLNISVNMYEEMAPRNGVLFQKLFRRTARKIVLVTKKNFETEAWGIANILRKLEQFIQIVKRQNIFWKPVLFILLLEGQVNNWTDSLISC